MQRRQVLSQLFIDLYVSRVNLTAHQEFSPWIVCWITAIDGIEVVEPKIIGLDKIQRACIFFSPVCHHACCI